MKDGEVCGGGWFEKKDGWRARHEAARWRGRGVRAAYVRDGRTGRCGRVQRVAGKVSRVDLDRPERCSVLKWFHPCFIHPSFTP